VKEDAVYLRHILDCLDAIEQYTRGDPQLFLADRKTHKAVLRELQELAQSTQRLCGQLKAKCPGDRLGFDCRLSQRARA
jgi:uncharacterized protein with HEPN domain